MMAQRIFKYYPGDFGDLTVDVLHMDLDFDVHDDHTRVRSVLHVQVRSHAISSLSLNAKDLEINDVKCPKFAATYHYDREKSIIKIMFGEEIAAGMPFEIITDTVCRPSDYVLEGLYFDVSPPGAPPQQITQCQQWGFQRIVPCIDDMTAKCTYTTKITADERYTNLITNGDVIESRHPVGRGRVSVTYDNSVTPMAPYLFFLGTGTYETFSRIFEYPDGSTFNLELLLPPQSDPDRASQALDILADAVLWIFLFTGTERYRRIDVRKKIFDLSHERDRLLASADDPTRVIEIRARLKELSDHILPGYQYTGMVYREIGMQNSDFGGMENVGNTTISMNRIIPFPQMTDPSYEYMIRVKVHEFYHNLNGSEVTGRTPFEIWLNEAVTVHIEEQYHASLFGEDYSRLQTVLQILSPDGGTLVHDRSAVSMPIEPDGFNDPNELITGVTYVKAPEFVRMIETLMGKENFARGLGAYHHRYSHGNATRSDWIAEMEHASGESFERMAAGWLKKTGYPEVYVSGAYEAAERKYRLNLEQKGEKKDEMWEFPFSAHLVDAQGNDIAGILVRVNASSSKIVFEDVPESAFVSLNRGYTFFGRVLYDIGDEALALQVTRDSDVVNRYIAFHTLLDREKRRLLDAPERPVSGMITDLIHGLIADEALIGTAGGQFLTIFESVDDEFYAHRYQALYEVKRKIQQAVAQRYRDSLISLYRHYQQKLSGGEDFASRIDDIKFRQAKNACLALLATLDTPDIHTLIKAQFEEAKNPSDRLAAFSLYLNSSAGDRLEVMARFRTESGAHPVSWEAYLAVIASISSGDAVELVRSVEQSPWFNIEQANDQRALYVRFSQNKKKSLQTESGRKFLRDALIRLSGVNEYSTVNALSVLGNIDRMEEEYHVPLVDMLVVMLRVLDPGRTPSVYNTARRLLRGSPGAMARYVAETGTSIDNLL